MACKMARHWQPPEGAENGHASGSNRLVIYNSLVDEKVPFIPAQGPDSKQITWYTCGPTVYDVAHMGHARNYVTFDIVRRVLEDYFGFNCQFVMNVTDVDDKIIMRARRNHLLELYKSEHKDVKQVLEFAVSAVTASKEKQDKKLLEAQQLLVAADAEPQVDKRRKGELQQTVKSEEHKATRIKDAQDALQQLKPTTVGEVLEVAGEYVAEVLDREHGAGVTDTSIFRAHAAKYEHEFLEDMAALGCRPATVLTRVSEYIPEVVSYVEKIMSNEMAYAAGGSVYFDTSAFRGSGHTYGKLKPWAVGSALLAAEGESNFETSEKRCPMDFALWKASRPGEPSWPSPWGQGRPGWHIECSAMASAVLGQRMDLHSGGEDLRFPHHDNELAQAEAHYHHEGCTQWVNYFLHSGHLEIEGLKMSKSLKNFITIKEGLKTFSARQLRLLFALQPWNKPMVYGEQAKGEMRAREAQIKHFFQNVEVAVREAGGPVTELARWEAPELELSQALQRAQAQVHAALLDNIDTPGALTALSELIRATNVYLADMQKAAKCPQGLLLQTVASYVTRILSVMGLVEAAADKPGFQDASSSGQQGDVTARLAPVLDAFSAFRDEVRRLCRSKADPRELMVACDQLRDQTMVDLGVRLEDRADGKAVWKLDDPQALRAEQAERARQAAEAALKKLQGALAAKAKELEKLEAVARLPPVEVALGDKYTQWDASTGRPTRDKEGQPLEGKALDKALKEVDKAVKVREPLAKKLQEDPECLNRLRAEVDLIRKQVELAQQQHQADTAAAAPGTAAAPTANGGASSPAQA